MKNTYTLLAVLVAVCTALPAAAQENLTNKVKRAAVNAEKAHRQHQLDDKAKNPDTPAVPVCAACGEEITSAYQHCQASGSTAICSPVPAPAAKSGTEEETPFACSVCGHVYSIDEKYHDVKHVCPGQKAAPVCAACGEETVESHQHCKATAYTGLCTPAKDKPSAAAKTYNGPTGGEPECGVIFIESSEPAVQHGPTGGEPETNFFFVISENDDAVGPTGGEPQSPWLEEINEAALQQAQQLWQTDRAANGHPEHTLEYYYKQVISGQNK